MENKTTKVNRLRLSPNEETQFVREELERRRKIRVQQVREQERFIAQEVRREVMGRQKVAIRNLSATLRDEWKNKRVERLHYLEKLDEDVLRAVGHGYRSAKKTEPDWCALAQTTNENNERAMKRHQQALRHLPSQRQEEVQRSRVLGCRLFYPVWHMYRIFPSPIVTCQKHQWTEMQTFCSQILSRQQCWRPSDWKSWRDRKYLIGRSNFRWHNSEEAMHSRRKKLFSARILCELDRLQQADLQERKQVVYNVPAQIFQQSYRCDEQQRELEMAFQDLYNAGKEVRDDFVLVPEPLSAPSVGSDEDLDVTLETTSREKTEAENASPAPPSQPIVNFGQTAVKRLLERIRSQRVQWNWQECTPGQGSATLENTSIELGSMTNQEWKYAPSLQEGKSYESQNAEIGLKVTEEPIRDGSMLLIEEQFTETKRSLWEWEQFRQQEKQLNFLYQLEDKRRYLEVQLLEAQLYREMPQNAVQVHIEMARNV
ncbi:centrosomal protein of 295 kDa isoform X2 [Salminus brasiliensis]|uniref:centrosomal protein of 295 kDa isoform X2 n=1 Tax=Salminus brasiliensis TaxID=930266 RepID=UPI003B8308B0